VADSGFAGVVLRLRQYGLVPVVQGERTLLRVGGGEDWDSVVRFAVEHRLAGIECLSGIPGLTGATPVQNVGAYGQEVADTLVSVRALNLRERKVYPLSASECRFGYRRSRFNHDEAGCWIILSVTFGLRNEGKPTLKYPDLQGFFGENRAPSLVDVYHAVRAIRARKGMVLDPNDRDTYSAGSFFKNPTLTREMFDRLRERVPDTNALPHYPQEDGTVKVPAAFLMEQAGLRRGDSFGAGRVALSTRHVLALTNRGGATATEVVAAAIEIQTRVEDTLGITLLPEPVFVGNRDSHSLPKGATVATPAVYESKSR
jgi:UDP-N-acetylmuramate dehydrogenase